MTRFALILATATFASPVLAQDTKIQFCGYQAEIVAATQSARIDRVKERDVPGHITGPSAAWPEKYNNTIPAIASWVYEQRRKDIRNVDLGKIWNDLCLQLQENCGGKDSTLSCVPSL